MLSVYNKLYQIRSGMCVWTLARVAKAKPASVRASQALLPVAFICCLHLPPAAAAGSGDPDRMLHFNRQMKRNRILSVSLVYHSSVGFDAW
jgi:hypothetical protein